MKNKRGGDNPLWKTLLAIIVGLGFLVGIVVYLMSMGNGELVIKEITAKQLCVIITGAENGTVVNITSKLIIEKNGQDIIVKKSAVDFGYAYSCNTKNFEIKKEDANTIIKIGESNV